MVHRLARPFSLVLLVLGLLALPTVQVGEAAPRSGDHVEVVRFPGDDRAVRLEVPDLVALSAEVDGGHVDVRWETVDGWSEWVSFEEPGDHVPDPGSGELAGVDRAMSDPVWTGEVEAVELRAHDAGPRRIRFTTMTGGLGYRADARPAASAEAFAVWPPIVPRTAWDPNGECQPRDTADVAPRAERIFIHHTAIFPDYPASAGDDVVRAVCLGHVKHRGFSDVGYNFLIDRYGVIYQGREGGILKAVEGAHAQGFNAGSIGVALVGDFHANGVPAEAARALDTLTAWLADLHGIDPLGRGLATSTGGDSTRFPDGFVVDLPNIVGHRDTGRNTACPGDHLFDIVRGKRPIAPRVNDRLVHEYGWDAERATAVPPVATTPPTSTPPAPPAPPVPPAGSSAIDVVRDVVGGVDQRNVVALVTRVLSSRRSAAVGR